MFALLQALIESLSIIHAALQPHVARGTVFRWRRSLLALPHHDEG
jgi:hypothetical protein